MTSLCFGLVADRLFLFLSLCCLSCCPIGRFFLVELVTIRVSIIDQSVVDLEAVSFDNALVTDEVAFEISRGTSVLFNVVIPLGDIFLKVVFHHLEPIPLPHGCLVALAFLPCHAAGSDVVIDRPAFRHRHAGDTVVFQRSRMQLGQVLGSDSNDLQHVDSLESLCNLFGKVLSVGCWLILKLFLAEPLDDDWHVSSDHFQSLDVLWFVIILPLRLFILLLLDILVARHHGRAVLLHFQLEREVLPPQAGLLLLVGVDDLGRSDLSHPLRYLGHLLLAQLVGDVLGDREAGAHHLPFELLLLFLQLQQLLDDALRFGIHVGIVYDQCHGLALFGKVVIFALGHHVPPASLLLVLFLLVLAFRAAVLLLALVLLVLAFRDGAGVPVRLLGALAFRLLLLLLPFVLRLSFVSLLLLLRGLCPSGDLQPVHSLDLHRCELHPHRNLFLLELLHLFLQFLDPRGLRSLQCFILVPAGDEDAGARAPGQAPCACIFPRCHVPHAAHDHRRRSHRLGVPQLALQTVDLAHEAVHLDLVQRYPLEERHDLHLGPSVLDHLDAHPIVRLLHLIAAFVLVVGDLVYLLGAVGYGVVGLSDDGLVGSVLLAELGVLAVHLLLVEGLGFGRDAEGGHHGQIGVMLRLDG
mmetsp:Transcript_21692/g.46434  ORF Transcript_21692/g.46434 Transcript_21692/m.46434 type:complete len:638 (-) Transcript_21692:14-1927(-)